MKLSFQWLLTDFPAVLPFPVERREPNGTGAQGWPVYRVCPNGQRNRWSLASARWDVELPQDGRMLSGWLLVHKASSALSGNKSPPRNPGPPPDSVKLSTRASRRPGSVGFLGRVNSRIVRNWSMQGRRESLLARIESEASICPNGRQRAIRSRGVMAKQAASTGCRAFSPCKCKIRKSLALHAQAGSGNRHLAIRKGHYECELVQLGAKQIENGTPPSWAPSRLGLATGCC
uniref:Uncharacterized protein n=1 Tax=Trichuris muris TaxID=70415 RepID=A0A5S6QA31_TRIMR